MKTLTTLLPASTVTWIALVLLTLLSFALSEPSVGRGFPAVILAAAVLKTSLVGFQFMDLRAAHPLWRVLFLAVLSALAVVLWLLRPAGA